MFSLLRLLAATLNAVSSVLPLKLEYYLIIDMRISTYVSEMFRMLLDVAFS